MNDNYLPNLRAELMLAKRECPKLRKAELMERVLKEIKEKYFPSTYEMKQYEKELDDRIPDDEPDDNE